MCPSSTSSSERAPSGARGPAALAARALRFALPLAAAFAALDGVLWLTGDALPARQVVRRQQAPNAAEVLYGRSFFSDQFGVYKRAAAAARRPRILIAGSSRVMQTRGFLFAPLDAAFYNGGGMLAGAHDVRALAAMVQDGRLPRPDVFIAGIDPWWLKTTSRTVPVLTETDEVWGDPGSHLLAVREMLANTAVWPALRGGPATPYEGFLGIGTRARTTGAGFREDGSYQPSPSVTAMDPHPAYQDREVPPVIERIRGCTHQFSAPAMVDTGRVEVILAALEALRDAGVEVHAFLPPFASEAFAELDRNPALQAWWRYYSQVLPVLLEKRGIDVIPVRTPHSIGLDDAYMLDAFHPSEVYMAHVVRDLVRAAPTGSLLKQVDVEALSARIASAYSPLCFDRPRLRPEAARALGLDERNPAE